ncbi:LamG-like jellyroll fold domain-containing protein [Streptomyces sp. NPDC088258]|uniref:LamG-like jellyroll fold domain-containing protein n=1 Tax=Streptomyces sp. NPDC088258 TaxID=3365849 RepID=UPI00380E5A3B
MGGVRRIRDVSVKRRRVRRSAVSGLVCGLVSALAVGLVPGTALPAVAQQPVREPKAAQAPEGDTDQATTADALAEAKRTGKPVEVGSLRGEHSDVYAQPDGSLEAREYLRSVRARVDGEWRPVDTDLAKAADGTVAPKVSTVEIRFSGGGDGPLVRMEKAGREVALSWPGSLPVPELADATATYRDVLPGVDLRMGAQEDGFTQLLVVKSAEAAASEKLAALRLDLATEGVNVQETAEGGLEAVDHGAQGAVFEAPKPMMWDSSTPSEAVASPARLRATDAEAEGAEVEAGVREPGAGESGKLAPVGVELPASGDALVLKPDADVLAGEDTVYPVFIDPIWYTPRASAWTMASKYWASSPQWKFNGDSDAGMGYCNWSYCQPNDTKRLFYRIPTSKFAGKTILSAEFTVPNTWSASCDARSVELWRTKDISSSTTWNAQNASGFWTKRLASKSFAYGFNGCAAKDAEFDVKAAVQDAANGKLSTMTFGLRAASESDGYAWKRFSSKASLRVRYNQPPPQIKMSQLTMEYGGTCKKPADAARVRTLGKIIANKVTDPDGDNVAVQFRAAWDSGDGKGVVARWTPSPTTSKKSGASFTVSLPSSIPANKRVHWYARSYDGAQYSPWSTAGTPTGCYFVYDTSVPKAPTISSGDYPASNPEDPEDPWLDGMGKYGAFTLKASDSDVVKYWYGVNRDPSSKNAVTTSGGAAKVLQLLPAEPGVNFVTAQAFDTAGNGSEIRTYQYRVKAGQPERAMWQMDEPTGAKEAAGTSGARVATLYGGTTLGVAGKSGTALGLDGTSGYASADIPTVNTSNGFSVSVWVKLDRMPDSVAVIAAQPGNNTPGFELYYSQGYDRWVFNQYTSDTAGASIARAMAPTAGGVSVDQWTHLVGVYSGGAKELQLYIDGKLVGQTPYTTAWDARRGLRIGAGELAGTVKNFFPGTIDDLRLFDKPVSATEVGNLFRQESIGNGRTARTIFSLDEEPGATEVVGYADAQPLSLIGDAKLGDPGMAGNSLTLGGNGYARTAAPHVDTQRPFAVSAWAKLDRIPGQAATVVAQMGANRPGFQLYYSGTFKRWGFMQYVTDTADSSQVRVLQPDTAPDPRPGDWVHLVGVHDPTADTLTLYVNGAKVGSVAQSSPWYAGGPVQAGALTTGSGNVSQYLPGQIDDIRVYDRVIADEEVQQLFKQRAVLKGRWNFETTAGTATVTTPDLSDQKNAMTLSGGAKRGAGWVDTYGLELDGINGSAGTSTMPIDTGSSFTVTAWAQGAATPDHSVAVVSGEGASQSAFNVRFVPDAKGSDGLGRWQLTLPDTDGTSAMVQQVNNTEFYDVRDWNHLAVVYDGFAKEARLYVNGMLQEIACGDGDGDSDDTACEDLISWADNVLTFKASKSLQVGRAKTAGKWDEYFAGSIDDVWAFQGALDEIQVGKLANAMFDFPTEVPSNS